MPSRQSWVRTLVFSASVTVGLLAFTGCGDSTNRVTGTVTFDGKPVPVGKIYFNPDNSKGNSGAGGYADIKDGKFDTSADGGRGTIMGPMKVAIEGFDPAKPLPKPKKGEEGGELPSIASLFDRWETTTDITGSEGELTFNVPAEAAKRKQAPEIGHVGP